MRVLFSSRQLLTYHTSHRHHFKKNFNHKNRTSAYRVHAIRLRLHDTNIMRTTNRRMANYCHNSMCVSITVIIIDVPRLLFGIFYAAVLATVLNARHVRVASWERSPTAEHRVRFRIESHIFRLNAQIWRQVSAGRKIFVRRCGPYFGGEKV